MVRIVFEFEAASARLQVLDDKHAILRNVFCEDRGKGYGRGLMQKIINYADERDLVIDLNVMPFGYSDAMTPNELISFYEKFGFKSLGPLYPKQMARLPSQEKQCL